MSEMTLKDLYQWCSVAVDQLEKHPQRRIPFRLVKDSPAMGELMARELVDAIAQANQAGREFRAIIPCGPKCWYEPFVRLVNQRQVSLRRMTVFHMDECLDWQGRLLPTNNPYNFKTFMLQHFYQGIAPELAVLPENRVFPEPNKIDEIEARIDAAPIDLTLGGWGQDGHLAYNQARRNAYSRLTLDQLRQSGLRVQNNNDDTLITLGHRSFGAAWQFVPPMSITLGLRQCLGAKQVRIFSDTGAWKQTALRVALFSPETVDYPMTLLQSHPDALITATRETAEHPIADNPDWEFPGVNA